MSDENQQNNQRAESYFQQNPPEAVETKDSASVQESFTLFGGDINNIEVFIKHEEVKLKFYEFKLKEKTQNGEANSKLQDRDNERKLRRENAKLAFQFAKYWAIFIGVFILMHGFNGISLCKTNFFFNISETEFMFVCGTLTASVLIFYLTVIRNLFPNKIEEKQSSEN